MGGGDTAAKAILDADDTVRLESKLMSPEKTKPTSQEKKASHIPKEGLEEVVSFDCDCCSDWNRG